MRISVCIPTVRPTTLAQAVRSILEQTFQDWELVVVGQGDEVALRAATERGAKGDSRVRYLHITRRGASVARNAGTTATTGELIAYLDDDCEAEQSWLATLDKAFGDDVGLVAGSLIAPPDASRRFAVCPAIEPADVVYDPRRMQQPPEGFGVLGANIAVRRTDAVHVGPFDECMGPGSFFQGGEEHDYVRRLAQLGVRMRSTPSSIVHHTYGVRYGWRAVYSHKRERIRGDGAVAAKGTLLEDPGGGRAIRDCVTAMAARTAQASPAAARRDDDVSLRPLRRELPRVPAQLRPLVGRSSTSRPRAAHRHGLARRHSRRRIGLVSVAVAGGGLIP